MSEIQPSRRRFLGAILATAVAPAIVRASSLMPVKACTLSVAWPEDQLMEHPSVMLYSAGGHEVSAESAIEWRWTPAMSDMLLGTDAQGKLYGMRIK